MDNLLTRKHHQLLYLLFEPFDIFFGDNGLWIVSHNIIRVLKRANMLACNTNCNFLNGYTRALLSSFYSFFNGLNSLRNIIDNPFMNTKTLGTPHTENFYFALCISFAYNGYNFCGAYIQTYRIIILILHTPYIIYVLPFFIFP